MRSTRPTAVNLAWALDRMLQKAAVFRDNPQEAIAVLTREAAAIALEDVEVNRAIGRYGAPLLPQEMGSAHPPQCGGLGDR